MPGRSEGSSSALGMVHKVGPWVAFAVVVVMVFGMYSGYKRDQAAWDAEHANPKPSTATTTTAPPKKPAATTPAKATTPKLSKVLVVSAVTLRKDPSSSSERIRGLEDGEKLTLVGQVGSWYKVTDSKGVVGWVSASSKYTKLVEGD